MGMDGTRGGTGCVGMKCDCLKHQVRPYGASGGSGWNIECNFVEHLA